MEQAIDDRERPVCPDVVAAHDPDHVAARYLEVLSPRPLSVPLPVPEPSSA
jgi:hypothetical protein